MEVKAVVCLFWISVQRASSAPEDLQHTVATATDEEIDFERLENEYALGNVSVATEAYANLTLSEVPTTTETSQPKLDNVGEFKPSMHLGEIEESRSFNSNPFNKPSHLKFENYFTVQPSVENWYKNDTKPFDKNGIDNLKPVHPVAQNFFSPPVANDNQYFRISNGGVSFPQTQLPSFQAQNYPTSFQNFPLVAPPLQRPEYLVNSPDKTYFENTFTQEIPQTFDQPVTFHDDANSVTPFNEFQNFGDKKQPSFENYEEPNLVHIYPEIQNNPAKRNQRFPYKFYNPMSTLLDTNLEYVTEEQIVHSVPRERRMSPWKKIIRLISTILPFGLLLATLSPNVIQIGNSTQSTIPLSKLKELNLPPEHKSLRMSDDQSSCEERTVCAIILAGSKPKSDLLQNVLWNFVTRTSVEATKDNGLRELFQAVKNKDCNLISC